MVRTFVVLQVAFNIHFKSALHCTHCFSTTIQNKENVAAKKHGGVNLSALTPMAARNYPEKLPVLIDPKHLFNSSALYLPITALAIVIFNHILSRISRPESGSCITLTIVAMSVLLAHRGRSSNSGGRKKQIVEKHTEIAKII